MSDASSYSDNVRLIRRDGGRGGLDGKGGGGDDGRMESRVTALETRLDTVLPTLATKADVVTMESRLVRWMAGIGIATVTVMISVLSFLYSRIDTKPAPAAPPPIIITIPGAVPSTPPPAPAPAQKPD